MIKFTANASTANQLDYIETTARARFFSGSRIATREVRVYRDGSVLVWDAVAGHFTRCHALSKASERKIARRVLGAPARFEQRFRGPNNAGLRARIRAAASKAQAAGADIAGAVEALGQTVALTARGRATFAEVVADYRAAWKDE